jgi:nucleoside 2-deoxyribosyltransferase
MYVRIYLSAQFSQQKEVAALRAAIDALHGPYRVAARWIDEPPSALSSALDSPTCFTDHLQATAEICERDLLDVSRCDLFVALTQSPQTPSLRGGRHVEFGYALALNKHIAIIGPRENVFHASPAVMQFTDIAEFLASLRTTPALWQTLVRAPVLSPANGPATPTHLLPLVSPWAIKKPIIREIEVVCGQSTPQPSHDASLKHAAALLDTAKNWETSRE